MGTQNVRPSLEPIQAQLLALGNRYLTTTDWTYRLDVDVRGGRNRWEVCLWQRTKKAEFGSSRQRRTDLF